MPRYREIYIKKEAKIIVWKIVESEEDLLLLLKNSQLPASFSAYKSAIHRKQFLATQILLQEEGLKDLLNKDINGKPFLENGFISISHDTKYVALIISNKLCGIDLQSVSDKVLRIKRKFYDDNDAPIIGDELVFLTKIWSIKEALYKVNGDPMVYFKEHLRIHRLEGLEVNAEVLNADYLASFTLEIRKIDTIYLAYTI